MHGGRSLRPRQLAGSLPSLRVRGVRWLPDPPKEKRVRRKVLNPNKKEVFMKRENTPHILQFCWKMLNITYHKVCTI